MPSKAKPTPAQQKTFKFKAETSQILRLMAQALYSNKEIFLRELITNASDAIDKLRFESVANHISLGGDAAFAISIEIDVQNSTLTVTDNGIGMSRGEIIDDLGTIARSGTIKFLKTLGDDKKSDVQQIGQFGVGFYSVFVVADRVEVESRRADADPSTAVRFTSTGKDNFQIENIEPRSRGTCVRLFLKPEEAANFLNGVRLREIIKKYTDHLLVPVKMRKESSLDMPGVIDEADSDEGEGSEPEVTEPEFETINQAQALWMRSRQEITQEEYEDFFQHLNHNSAKPLGYTHNKVEGKLEYTSLLYIPKEPGYNVYKKDQPNGLKLYVQRIFIMDSVEQFLPRYLRFVSGLIDTNDLPLNISRELLQDDRRIATIRSALTKRVLDLLTKLADDDPQGYVAFWEIYGAAIKEGIIDDYANINKLKPLLRYHTALSDDDKSPKSLQSYVDEMPQEQEQIYYLLCETHELGRNNPHLEALREKGFDVLLCADPVDSWAVPQIETYQDKSFQDITRATFKLNEDDSDQESKNAEDSAETATSENNFSDLAEALTGKVKAVTISKRLTESPSCLVLDEHDLNENMRHLLKLTSGETPPESVPTLELNPDHPLVQMTAGLKGDELKDVALILYEQAILTEGRPLVQPANFVKSLNRVILKLAGQDKQN